MNEKIKLEKAACNYFINSYNKLNRTSFAIRNHQDKPDFIVEDHASHEILGIEITHLFYDGDEATMLLDRSDNEIHGVMRFCNLIKVLNNKLQEKMAAARNYCFEHRMFLVIRVASPIFDKEDFDIFKEDIIIPQNTFDQIWLLLRDSKQLWGDLKRLQ